MGIGYEDLKLGYEEWGPGCEDSGPGYEDRGLGAPGYEDLRLGYEHFLGGTFRVRGWCRDLMKRRLGFGVLKLGFEDLA